MGAISFGTTYYSHANPPEEIERNLRAIRAMGIDTVRLAEVWPGWSVIETSEDHYDFGLIDDYVEKAERSGLTVCMGVGINDTPQWLFYRYPNLRFRDVDGMATNRRVQSACFDHAEYRRHMERFIRAITARYDGSPAVTRWQFGNEIRYNVSTCDCDSTRVRFREWLQTQYADLNALNRAWGTSFADWDQIYPYRSQEGAPTEGLAPLCMKSIQFQRWSVEELVSWGTSIMREHTDLPIFHNNYGALGQDGSHWRLTEPADYACIDIYANTAKRPGFYNGLFVEIGRSIATQQDKPLMIGETAIGQYGTYRRVQTDRRLIECCVVEQLAAGAQTLFYFRYKPPKWEQPHKFTGAQTIVRVDESPMEYIETPRRMKQLTEQLADRISGAVPPRPTVAIYYAEENTFFGRHVGYGAEARESLFGSRVLWTANRIPVEIVDRKAVEDGLLSAFSILYLPVAWQLPRSVTTALREFVAAGGTLICEGRPAYVDEDGLLYNAQPGGGLDEVFGCREDLYWMENSYSVYDTSGREFSGCYQYQSYRLDGGRALLSDRDGNPVAVTNEFGEGRAVLLGGAPSMAFTTGGSKYFPDQVDVGLTDAERRGLLTLINELAAGAGVTSPFPLRGGDEHLTVRELQNKTERLLFLVNYAEETPQQITLQHEAVEIRLDGEVEAPETVEIEPLSWKILSLKPDPPEETL